MTELERDDIQQWRSFLGRAIEVLCPRFHCHLRRLLSVDIHHIHQALRADTRANVVNGELSRGNAKAQTPVLFDQNRIGETRSLNEREIEFCREER